MQECTLHVTILFSLVIKISQIYFIRDASSGETSIKRTQFSADDWRARSETVRLQLSNYKEFKLDSFPGRVLISQDSHDCLQTVLIGPKDITKTPTTEYHTNKKKTEIKIAITELVLFRSIFWMKWEIRWLTLPLPQFVTARPSLH